MLMNMKDMRDMMYSAEDCHCLTLLCSSLQLEGDMCVLLPHGFSLGEVTIAMFLRSYRMVAVPP
jgi:hypothetical protein